MQATDDQTAVERKANGKQPAVFHSSPSALSGKQPPARANGTKPRSGFGIVSYTISRHFLKMICFAMRQALAATK